VPVLKVTVYTPEVSMTTFDPLLGGPAGLQSAAVAQLPEPFRVQS
jgi:hypothetical protein